MSDDFADLRNSFFSDDEDDNAADDAFGDDPFFADDAPFDETIFNEDTDLVDDLPSFDTGEDDLEDEFDQLRMKSARGETMHGGLENEEVAAAAPSGSRFSLRNFSPAQRVVIALLVVLDLVVILLGILVVAGIVG